MKNILRIAFAISLVLGVTAFIHIPTAAAVPGWAALPQGVPLKTIQGTVKVDGPGVVKLLVSADARDAQPANPMVNPTAPAAVANFQPNAKRPPCRMAVLLRRRD